MAKLIVVQNRNVHHKLDERTRRMRRSEAPMTIDRPTSMVQFLRGISAEASQALPVFYLLLGASSNCQSDDGVLRGYPRAVFRAAHEASSLSFLTLTCRKAFDHPRKGMTGGLLSSATQEELESVAKHWAATSGSPFSDAMDAVRLVKRVFEACARHEQDLLKVSSALARRIALLKLHANRRAAHHSLDDFELTVLDCAHFVAALVIVGEIVRSFDDPKHSPTYFDELDDASWTAAKIVFPKIAHQRIFALESISLKAKRCWQRGEDRGLRMILDDLPEATGWW